MKPSTRFTTDAVSDEGLKEKLRSLQAKQIKAAGGPEGNWLILADRSPSMQHAIELAKEVAGSITSFVKGRVWLVFFDIQPMTVDVTGLSLDQIKKATEHIKTGNGTSIGCGLDRMLREKAEIDGIALISDGGENSAPYFPDVYKKYCEFIGKDVPVYFYNCVGDRDNLSERMNRDGHQMQAFDLRTGKVDYYAIPNMVQTMRSNPYSLVDEILAVPLLDLSDAYSNVFKKDPVGV